MAQRRPSRGRAVASRMPGNTLYARLGKIDDRLDVHEARLDYHEKELRELNLDVAQLTDIAIRRTNASARLLRRMRATRLTARRTSRKGAKRSR